MRFYRGFKRFVAGLTTVSLVLPIALLALTSAPAEAAGPAMPGTAGSISIVSLKTSSQPSAVTLQAQDLLGLLNGEIGGIPQFGLAARSGLEAWSPAPISDSLRGENQTMASRIDAVRAAQTETAYAAVPLPADAASGLPGFALAGSSDDVLLKADVQASGAYKLSSPASMPRLIETPLQALATRTQAVTIKDLMDGTLAAATAPVMKSVAGSGIVHAFGSLLSAQKPIVDASPFGRALATVVFVPFTVELVSLLLNAPDWLLTAAPPAWMAVLLNLLIGLAGLVAVGRAMRAFSIKSASLVFLKREQRE